MFKVLQTATCDEISLNHGDRAKRPRGDSLKGSQASKETRDKDCNQVSYTTSTKSKAMMTMCLSNRIPD